jgi:hypothetical protein
MVSTYNYEGVRQERTGWRDQEISARHREWGFNCPAVDLDFLMVEYNIGKPVGLVEYKHHKAQLPNLNHPTYRALIDLADTAGLPFIIAFYWPGIWAFRVMPVNDIAKEHFGINEDFSEYDFVRLLYMLRHLTIDATVLRKLRREYPPSDENDLPF